MHNLLSVGTCWKTHNLLPKKKKKKLLFIYLNNNIKFLKSALIPARALVQGWPLSCLLTNCSLKPRTQVKVWKMKLMESHGFEGESLEIPAGKPAIPFEIYTVLCTYSQVCPGKRGASDRAWNCLSSNSLGSKPRTKDCEFIYIQEPHGNYGPDQEWAQPHSSSVLPNL